MLGPLIVAMKEEATLMRLRMKDPLISYLLRINASKPKFNKAGAEKVVDDIVRIREEIFGAFNSPNRDKLGKLRLTESIMEKETRGVPQGGPHSPLIAMLGKTISDLNDPDNNNNVRNHIQYVDDGITDRAIVGNEASGSLIQYAKTG